MFRFDPHGEPADPPNLLWLCQFEKQGNKLLGFGMKMDKTRLWLLENDLPYAQWIVAENTKNPASADDPFAKTARWLEEAFLIMRDRDEAFLVQLCKLKRAAEQKAFEERRREQDEVRALKVLRRSTANGQLALLPTELLMHILSKLGRNPYIVRLNPILNLPRVCHELRRSLGPLHPSSPRMGLMIVGTFGLLEPIKSKITGGTRPPTVNGLRRLRNGVGFDIQYRRLWNHMKMLASKTLIDIEYTQIRVARDFSPAEYQELAVRSMQQRDFFISLRHEALVTYRRMENAKKECEKFVNDAYYSGDYNVNQINARTQAVTTLRKKLADLVASMRELNNEEALCLVIPKMFKTTGGERALMEFLSA